jgi:selenocysteine lyase/cysteine desulfurase
MTPGGFHSFEHRWALAEAFRFQRALGRAQVAARTRALARQLKEGLAAIRDVRVVTPADKRLSAGIVCFEVRHLASEYVVARLLGEGVLASITPYAEEYVRLGTSILTGPQDVEAALRAVRALV